MTTSNDKFTRQTLTDIHVWSPNLFSLRCTRDAGFRFNAGQFARLGVRKASGSIVWRGYSMVSAPHDEALEFFADHKDITSLLQPLQDVGLGYIGLGQSSSTLSGGEAQRIKLASFLNRQNNKDHIFFIFDEPTTGLHFHDIQKLMIAFNALVEAGHTVLVIEHNLDVIKCADYIIDLGKEGGENGGNLLYQGTPEGLAACEDSFTGEFLRIKLQQHANPQIQ